MNDAEVERELRAALSARADAFGDDGPDPAAIRAAAGLGSPGRADDQLLPPIAPLGRYRSKRLVAAISAVAVIAAVAVLAVVLRGEHGSGGERSSHAPAGSITDPAALVGVTWKLTKLLDPRGVIPAAPDAAATLVVDPSGAMYDNGGDAAVAVLARGRMRFTQGWVNNLLIGTRLGVTQMGFFSAVMAGNVSWSITGRVLTVTRAGTGALVFVRSQPTGPRLATCGRSPVSTGPLASRIAVVLHAPASARSGTTITPTVRLYAIHGTVRITNASQPVDVVIVRNGYVVGRYDGAVGGTGWVGSLSSLGRRIPTAPLLLSGCPSGPLDPGHPDASRRQLPPGRYQLVADFEVRPNEFLASSAVTLTLAR